MQCNFAVLCTSLYLHGSSVSYTWSLSEGSPGAPGILARAFTYIIIFFIIPCLADSDEARDCTTNRFVIKSSFCKAVFTAPPSSNGKIQDTVPADCHNTGPKKTFSVKE